MDTNTQIYEDLVKLSGEELGKLFSIKISEHNPDWRNQFMSEEQTIQKAIGIKNILSIEHIGLQYLDCAQNQQLTY